MYFMKRLPYLLNKSIRKSGSRPLPPEFEPGLVAEAAEAAKAAEVAEAPKAADVPEASEAADAPDAPLAPDSSKIAEAAEAARAAEAAEIEKSIIVNKRDKVTLIAINRPEKKNALDSMTAQLLCNALDEFEKDENAMVGVLHGIGGNFCSGFDLHEIANYNQGKEDNLPQYGTLANRNELCSKPLVACLNGYVLGAGLELALMCDLRIIEGNAVVGFLNRRFGIPILCGGTVRLPAMIGYARAMDLILTGKAITGQEAFNIGLATKCTTHGTGLGQAINYARSLTKFPQKALLADRASVNYAAFSSKQLDEALQFERDNALHLLTEEGVEGAKKFTEEGIGKHGKFYNLTKKDDNIKELDKSLV